MIYLKNVQSIWRQFKEGKMVNVSMKRYLKSPITKWMDFRPKKVEGGGEGGRTPFNNI